jgi:hypothetical protein
MRGATIAPLPPSLTGTGACVTAGGENFNTGEKHRDFVRSRALENCCVLSNRVAGVERSDSPASLGARLRLDPSHPR